MCLGYIYNYYCELLPGLSYTELLSLDCLLLLSKIVHCVGLYIFIYLVFDSNIWKSDSNFTTVLSILTHIDNNPVLCVGYKCQDILYQVSSVNYYCALFLWTLICWLDSTSQGLYICVVHTDESSL